MLPRARLLRLPEQTHQIQVHPRRLEFPEGLPEVPQVLQEQAPPLHELSELQPKQGLTPTKLQELQVLRPIPEPKRELDRRVP